MTAFAFHPFAQAGLAMPVAAPPMPRACAVRLIDRRTGAAHRINGRPLTLFTRRPQEAAAELLEGRDASLWEVRIDPIEPEVRQ
ncbi:hypothetical protein [Frigidibacter sp.]|uniref:hypothetical protein n=1 Tax=Frigidibacter sp. TaxID=2586418 RepID=UPI0027329DA3|nr:hypothetical protein [Frigidibacter sp.]MDP3341890.1 hypothetical protein [Frigidibacter sp.]